MSMIMLVISGLVYVCTLIVLFLCLTFRWQMKKIAVNAILPRVNELEAIQIYTPWIGDLVYGFQEWSLHSLGKKSATGFGDAAREEIFRKFFIANSGLFIGRLLYPGAVSLFSSLLSALSLLSLVFAAINIFMGHWFMVAVGGIISLYILMVSSIPAWFPLTNDEMVCFKRSILNFKQQYPAFMQYFSDGLVVDDRFFVDYYIRGRILGFSYYDAAIHNEI